MSLIERIEALYLWRGRRLFESDSDVRLTHLQHALQTAQLAEWDDAADPVVAAAFLHDIGLLLPMAPGSDTDAHPHELRAVAFLADGFDERVLEPIGLHVQAGRYLATLHRGYEATLSTVSRQSIARRGGPMSAPEVQRFEAHPFAADAVRLRRWDDCAPRPTRRTPPLAWYLGLLETMLERGASPRRIAIGSMTVS